MDPFAEYAQAPFTTYRMHIRFQHWLVGTKPMDPKMFEGWIKAKLGLSDEEQIKRAAAEHWKNIVGPGHEEIKYDDVDRAAELIAEQKGLNGFHRDRVTGQPYLDGYMVFAMLKEAVSVLYDGQWWGGRPRKDGKGDTTGKSPKAWFIERVFVNPKEIALKVDRSQINERGVLEPDIYVTTGAPITKDGPRQIIGRYERFRQPEIEFEVSVLKDAEQVLTPDKWGRIWVYARRLCGLGGLRNYNFGTFDTLSWEQVKPGEERYESVNGGAELPMAAD